MTIDPDPPRDTYVDPDPPGDPDIDPDVDPDPIRPPVIPGEMQIHDTNVHPHSIVLY